MSAFQQLKRNKGAIKKKRRVGRGIGSGIGATSRRGENGQKSRTGGSIKPGFRGGSTSLLKKMPKLKGFKNPNQINHQVINIGKLNKFENGDQIDLIKLFEAKLVKNKQKPVKILGGGDLEKKLTIKVDQVSDSAKAKIEQAGGTVISLAKQQTPQSDQ